VKPILQATVEGDIMNAFGLQENVGPATGAKEKDSWMSIEQFSILNSGYKARTEGESPWSNDRILLLMTN
jgi:hypothetical protein